MKVLFVIDNLAGGGAQQVLLTAVAGLRRRGHEAVIVTLTDRRDYDSDVRVESLGGSGSSGWLAVQKSAYKLRRFIRAQSRTVPFDLIISALPKSDKVVQVAGLKPAWHWIHNTHSELPSAETKANPQRMRRVLGRIKKKYDGRNLIAVSEGVARDLRDKAGCSSADIRVIYNPFDFDAIREKSRLPVEQIPVEPFVLHAGRFAPQKRHDILLDAYSLSGIPHKLVLLTKPAEGLHDLIRARGLEGRVVVAGFQSNPYAWYARASTVILSSDFEGFGNVLVEAMLCGTPVVSTDCPSGPSEILDGELKKNLSPVGDVAALAANIRTSIDDAGEIAVSGLDRFSISAYLDAIERLRDA